MRSERSDGVCLMSGGILTSRVLSSVGGCCVCSGDSMNVVRSLGVCGRGLNQDPMSEK